MQLPDGSWGTPSRLAAVVSGREAEFDAALVAEPLESRVMRNKSDLEEGIYIPLLLPAAAYVAPPDPYQSGEGIQSGAGLERASVEAGELVAPLPTYNPYLDPYDADIQVAAPLSPEQPDSALELSMSREPLREVVFDEFAPTPMAPEVPTETGYRPGIVGLPEVVAPPEKIDEWGESPESIVESHQPVVVNAFETELQVLQRLANENEDAINSLWAMWGLSSLPIVAVSDRLLVLLYVSSKL